MTEQHHSFMLEAEKAADNAYAPFSYFYVEAVLMTESGQTYHGCNVENLSYGLTVCAERNAVFQAVSKEGPQMRLERVYIAMKNHKEGSPCGACRQVLAEFSTSKTKVFYRLNGKIVEKTMAELLPDAFDKL